SKCGPSEWLRLTRLVQEDRLEAELDLAVPDILQCMSQILAIFQKERNSDLVIAIVDRRINGLQGLDQLIRGKVAAFELAAQDLIVGPKVNEAEASPQGMIDKRDGAVGGVH